MIKLALAALALVSCVRATAPYRIVDIHDRLLYACAPTIDWTEEEVVTRCGEPADTVSTFLYGGDVHCLLYLVVDGVIGVCTAPKAVARHAQVAVFDDVWKGEKSPEGAGDTTRVVITILDLGRVDPAKPNRISSDR